MAWCPKSFEAASAVCQDLVRGASPGEAIRRALEILPDHSPTCLEDVGRSTLKLGDARKCAEILSKAEPPGDPLAAALQFIIPYTYYRRIRDVDRMRELVRVYEGRAPEGSLLWVILLHAKAMLIEKTEEFSLETRILDALRLEARVLEASPGYVGAAHKFADLVAQLLEEGYTPGSCREPGGGCVPEEYVRRAEFILRWLARDYRYARAYYTLARIATALGRYQEAESLVSAAISLEDPRVGDYMLRLSEYYNLLFLARNMARMEEKLKAIDRMIEDRLEAAIDRMIAEARRTEERLLAWTSIYVAVIAIIFTYLYTISSPEIGFTQIILLLLVIYGLIIATIYLVYRLLLKERGYTTAGGRA